MTRKQGSKLMKKFKYRAISCMYCIDVHAMDIARYSPMLKNASTIIRRLTGKKMLKRLQNPILIHCDLQILHRLIITDRASASCSYRV